MADQNRQIDHHNPKSHLLRPPLPRDQEEVFTNAKREGFKLLIDKAIELSEGNEFVYCYSFKRDRERPRYTWHYRYPFRRRRHLAKVGKASGDPIQAVKGQFAKESSEDELITRSVPEYPQIEMVVFVDDALECERAFHNYVRRYQYLGGAGYEFFFTCGDEVLRFCKIWTKNRRRAIRLGDRGKKAGWRLLT